MSILVEILIPYNPSKHEISEDFDHTNNYNSLKAEGSKKRKLEDVSPVVGQSFFGDASQLHKKHSSVEGFEQKADIRNLQSTLAESEDLCLGKSRIQFQEIWKHALNKIVKVAHIEDGLHNSKSGVE